MPHKKPEAYRTYLKKGMVQFTYICYQVYFGPKGEVIRRKEKRSGY